MHPNRARPKIKKIIQRIELDKKRNNKNIQEQRVEFQRIGQIRGNLKLKADKQPWD
jgi:hypothetical protein